MEWSKIFNIIFGVLGGIFTFIAAIYTSWHRRTLREEGLRRDEIERQFKVMWLRIDETKKELASVQKQMDVLQGEHNVMACTEKQKGKR